MSGNLGIGELSIGVSHAGMQAYRDNLKMDILKTTKEKIDADAEVKEALANAWQGKAHDDFVKMFDKEKQTIKDDLEKEYRDLEHRLTELESMYFDTDKNMME